MMGRNPKLARLRKVQVILVFAFCLLLAILIWLERGR